MKTLDTFLSEASNLPTSELGRRPGTSEYSNECFFLEIDEFSDCIHILYLVAYRQGDGYGRAVVEALLDYGRMTGKMVTVISPLTDAVSFWIHLGFVEHPHNPDQLIPEGFFALLAA